MDPDINILSTYVPSLVKWNPNDIDGLLNVLSELLLYYKDYQVNNKYNFVLLMIYDYYM